MQLPGAPCWKRYECCSKWEASHSSGQGILEGRSRKLPCRCAYNPLRATSNLTEGLSSEVVTTSCAKNGRVQVCCAGIMLTRFVCCVVSCCGHGLNPKTCVLPVEHGTPKHEPQNRTGTASRATNKRHTKHGAKPSCCLT